MWRCDIDVMQSNLYQDLDNLYYWFRDNKLIFKLSVNGSPIYTITCYRYLGVHLDPTLNYDTHFHEMHKKVAARVNFFRRIRSSNDTSSALRIYQSMIMPILTHCSYNSLGWSESRKRMIHFIETRSLEIISPKCSPQNCDL